MRSWIPALALVLISACGGGEPALPAGGLADATAYSSQPDAQLAGAAEAAAVTRQRLVLGAQTLDYTASAGHLIARDALTGVAQAKVFYVAYTLDAPADVAARPVIFFYNGGPGSATTWLHLGSFGPKRLVTGVPATTAARPFPLVDNADTLLDTADLVFVNAVGSGRSQAIAPFVNRDFWGVDSDAALFRDIVRRWLDMHARQASPFFLYGESYGGLRTALLVRRLQEIGLFPAGLVLQAPALDYNSNCAVIEHSSISCAGYLPSLAATGAWHGLTQPVPTDLPGWLDSAREFAASPYGTALDAYLAGAAAELTLAEPLAALTGLAATHWQNDFNLGPTLYRGQLIPARLLGRYDARMTASVGSPLAADGDPSITWLLASFESAIDSYLHDVLAYRNDSTHVLMSQAISYWDFSHAERELPDGIPDLAAALDADPALRVLAVGGLHDLATPFHVTERDLGRIDSSRIQVRNYIGGHMSYLDDDSRPVQRADVAAFVEATVAIRAAQATRREPLRAMRPAPPDRAGTPEPATGPQIREPAIQAPLRDPWVPPR